VHLGKEVRDGVEVLRELVAVRALRVTVQGLGSGFGVLVLRVWGMGLRVWGSGSGVCGVGIGGREFEVQSLVYGAGCLVFGVGWLVVGGWYWVFGAWGSGRASRAQHTQNRNTCPGVPCSGFQVLFSGIREPGSRFRVSSSVF
jgi:hypothetical protein